MRLRLIVLYLVVLGFSSGAGGEILSLDDCIREAQANNPLIGQAQARYEASRARARSTEKLVLPSFNTRLSYVRLSDVDPFSVQTPFGTITVSEPVLDTYQATLTVQQPLFTGFRLGNQVELARQGVTLSQLGLEYSNWDLRFEVIKAYYNLINARAARRVIDESLKTMAVHVQDVHNFKEAGLATTNEVLQTEVRLSNLHVQLNQAENGVELAELALATLLNRPDAKPFEIEENVVIDHEPVPPVEVLLDLAQANRLELRQLDVREQIADHALAISRSDYYPTVLASGAYNYARPNNRYQPPEEEFNSDWSIGLSVSWVPFDWGKTRSNVQQYQAERREIEALHEQVSQQVRAQVIRTYAQHRETFKRLELVRTTVRQATENLRVAHDQYNEGMSRNTDVLDAETLQLQANLDQTRAELDYLLTRALLTQAVGSSAW
ncbi:TolC family protein [bacterium]|nr:TolC family protein [bacterium]